MKEFILLLIAMSVLFGVIILGVNQHEKVECFKWRSEAKTYPGYYFTDWQVDQCEVQGVPLE